MAKNAPYLQTDLHGKTVVFSGGTDGMGKTAVEKLAKLGARIMLLGRSKEKTMAVVKEINEMAQQTDGDAVHYVPCIWRVRRASERQLLSYWRNVPALTY